MRKSNFWIYVFLIVIVIIISPRGIAGKSVFGVSEELMEAIEQEKAFERYLAENNFQLENQFPFLQSNLLPVPLVQRGSYFWGYLNPGMNNGLFATGGSYVTSGGNFIEKYPLLPSEYMNLVFYDESEKYTIGARSQVVNGFTISYGYNTTKAETEDYTVNSENKFVAQNAGLEFKFIPGMSLNADYTKTLGAPTDEAKKSVHVAYEPVNFASISAGYSVISTNTNPFDFSALMANDSAVDQDDIIVKQLGLALRPTTNSQISASYIFVNEKGEPIRSTRARFAFRLGDSGTGLNATYEMENDENHLLSTSAGLESGLLDLATLKAVYSTSAGDETVDEGSPSSTVNLGLNLNLASYSSFHLQYKLILPEDLLEESEEEQVAEAKLVLRF